jgi:P-type E1-E2 ATPase
MIEVNIPGRGVVFLEHLVCDVNGTIAIDGELIEGIPRIISELKDRLEIHLLTADTHGRQEFIDQKLNLKAVRVHPGDEKIQKANYINRLGSDRVVAIGQGANDASMLKKSAIGICVFSPEGTALETLNSADLIVPDIFSAFGLLQNPLRLVASLRK